MFKGKSQNNATIAKLEPTYAFQAPTYADASVDKPVGKPELK